MAFLSAEAILSYFEHQSRLLQSFVHSQNFMVFRLRICWCEKKYQSGFDDDGHRLFDHIKDDSFIVTPSIA
jgi:hypothetical protein